MTIKADVSLNNFSKVHASRESLNMHLVCIQAIHLLLRLILATCYNMQSLIIYYGLLVLVAMIIVHADGVLQI